MAGAERPSMTVAVLPAACGFHVLMLFDPKCLAAVLKNQLILLGSLL
jgi:hypothetical protein